MDPHYKIVSLQDPLDIRQVTYSNLLLLGFNAKASEHKWRIPFDKDMFALPNKKGFEVVMQFLLNRLNPVRFREEFRDCWPVGDKKQEHQFRKACCDWLSKLAKEEDARLPKINAALFMSPGGDKFYQLLHALSVHVMKQAIHTEHGMKQSEYLRRPTLTLHNAAMEDAFDHILQCGTSRERQRFLDHVQQGCSVQDYWRNYSTELVRDYRALNRKVKELERELKTEVQSLAQKGSAHGIPASKRGMMLEYEMEVGSVKRTEHIRKCREMWRNLEEFYQNISKEREILEDVLENDKNKYKLDATELNVRVPDLLLRECEQEIHQRNVNNIFEGGRLNLLSVIHLWNLSLHLYIEKLHQTGIPTFDKVMPSVSAQVHSHKAHLANAMALKKQLSGMLPDLKSSISNLRKKMDTVLFHSKSPESIRITSVGLGLLPPTPPINFDFEGVSYKQDEVTKSLAKTPGMETNVSTPEGANALMDKIQRKVRADGASPLVQGSPVYGGRLMASNVAKMSQSHGSKLPKYETRPDSAQAHRKPKLEQGKGASHTKKNEKGTSRKSMAMWTPLPTGDSNHSASSKRRQSDRNDSLTAFRHSKPLKSFKIPQSVPHRNTKQQIERTGTLAAHDILADRIAEELLAATPRRQSLSRAKEEPFNLELALGDTAFESRDKLGRTPPTKPQASTWHETLMQRMDGPLSSTRLEHSSPATTQPVRDKVVTKLFTDEDGYCDSVDVGLSDVASTISATESRNPEIVEDEEDARVLELVNNLREEAREWFDSGEILTSAKDEDLTDSLSHTPVINLKSSQIKIGSGQQEDLAGDSDSDDILNEPVPFESDLTPDRNWTTGVDDASVPFSGKLTSKPDGLLQKESTRSPVLPERLRSLLSMGSVGEPADADRTPELDTIKKSRRSLRTSQPESSLLNICAISDFLGPESGAAEVQPSQTYGRTSDSESEEIDSQNRVIEVQNGSYKETVEPSPSKQRASVTDEWSTTSAVAKAPHIKQSLTGSTTSDLLARYKRLHMQMPVTDNLLQSALKVSEPVRSTEPLHPVDMSPKPSEHKAPISEIYLQRTPNKVVNTNKRSLSFLPDDEEIRNGRDLSTSSQRDVQDDVNPQQSWLPLKELNVNTSSFPLSPMSTPKKQGGTPGYGFSSIPVSPLTDVLHHNEGLTDMGSSRRSENVTRHPSASQLKLLSILDEDDSVLLPPSPPNANFRNSPLTAKLIDF